MKDGSVAYVPKSVDSADICGPVLFRQLDGKCVFQNAAVAYVWKNHRKEILHSFEILDIKKDK